MRWPIERRFRRKFVWLPTKIGRYWIWLEFLPNVERMAEMSDAEISELTLTDMRRYFGEEL